MNKADHFNAIADLLETQGWIQGEMRNTEGRCLIGARNDTVCLELQYGDWGRLHDPEDGVIRLRWLHEFASWLVPQGAAPHESAAVLIDWNDDEGRTKDDVILALRKYAEEVAGE